MSSMEASVQQKGLCSVPFVDFATHPFLTTLVETAGNDPDTESEESKSRKMHYSQEWRRMKSCKNPI